MTDQKNRIKLAELMGWEWQRDVDMPTDWTHGQWLSPNKGWLTRGDKLAMTPDPFTDANDDYAVLEFMRETHPNNVNAHLADIQLSKTLWYYQIGDYARAALKVME